jgi:hypothetical protein
MAHEKSKTCLSETKGMITIVLHRHRHINGSATIDKGGAKKASLVKSENVITMF